MTGTDERARLTAWVAGRVQGVGFRWFVRQQAGRLGLAGSATNLDDGRVEVVAEGPADALRDLLTALRGPEAPGHVRHVVEQWSTPNGDTPGFSVH